MAVNLEVLLQDLVDTFSLSIIFWMISRGKVQLHVKGFSKRSKEMRYKLGSAIRSYMGWNTVFGEYMNKKEFSKLSRCDSVMSQNKDGLFSEVINHYQDSGKPFRVGEMFDEVHRNGFPRTGWNRKLSEKTIGFMTFCF